MKVRELKIFATAALLTAALGLVSNKAHAQDPACSADSMRASFVLGDGNRLSAAQLNARVVGKRINFSRMESRGTMQFRFQANYRPDGSLSVFCEVRSTGPQMPGRTVDWQPCRSMDGTQGARDVGAWRMTDAKGIVCSRRTARDPNDFCYSFHEQGGRFAVNYVSGTRSCFAGDVELH